MIIIAVTRAQVPSADEANSAQDEASRYPYRTNIEPLANRASVADQVQAEVWYQERTDIENRKSILARETAEPSSIEWTNQSAAAQKVAEVDTVVNPA